jgi:hypothetical protein
VIEDCKHQYSPRAPILGPLPGRTFRIFTKQTSLGSLLQNSLIIIVLLDLSRICGIEYGMGGWRQVRYSPYNWGETWLQSSENLAAVIAVS